MRRLIALVALVALVGLSACTRNSAVEVIPRDELDQSIYGEVSVERTTSVDLYFVEGNRLAKVTRTGPATRPLHEVAMIQLMRGPNTEELNDRQLTTAISDTTEFLGVSVSDGVASVDFSEDFYRPVDNSPEAIQDFIRRLAQVVWTATEIQGITRVQFLENGLIEPVVDQRRVPTRSALARNSYRQFAPRADRSLNTEQLNEL